MKGVVAGISTAFCYAFIFITAFSFPFMTGWQLWAGPLGTFALYAFIALLGVIFMCLTPLESVASTSSKSSPCPFKG